MSSNCIDDFYKFDMTMFKKYTKGKNAEEAIKAIGDGFGLKVAATPCNYGGVRYWFVCPKCEKRFRVLYYQNEKILCRNCLNINYLSSQHTKTKLFYAHRRVRQVIDKVDPSYPTYGRFLNRFDFPDKPKGMHWNTYERLHDEYMDELNRLLYAWISGHDVSTRQLIMMYARNEIDMIKLKEEAMIRVYGK